RHFEQDLTLTVHEFYGSRLGLVLLLHSHQVPPPTLYGGLAKALQLPVTRRWSKTWWSERIPKRVLHHDVTTDNFLRANRIQALVFGRAPDGSAIPTVGLVPDFQPFYLPEFFPPEEQERRRHELHQVG